MITRVDVAAEARRWIGTRWHHQAALKGVGCDCIGLVAGVGSALGLPEAAQWLVDARRLSYGRAPDPLMLRAAAADYLVEIDRIELGIGDIALMRIAGPAPQHFGVISDVGPRLMVHAHATARRVVETVFEGEWFAACCAAYRYRGVA